MTYPQQICKARHFEQQQMTDQGSNPELQVLSLFQATAWLTPRPETIHYFSLKEQFPLRVMDGLPLTSHKPTLFLTLHAAAPLQGFTVN